MGKSENQLMLSYITCETMLQNDYLTPSICSQRAEAAFGQDLLYMLSKRSVRQASWPIAQPQNAPKDGSSNTIQTCRKNLVFEATTAAKRYSKQTGAWRIQKKIQLSKA